MKPYYEADGITIYHGDCREMLPLAADLVVTDPPYGVSWQSGRRKEAMALITGDESEDVAYQGLVLAVRGLKRKRHVYIFGRFSWVLADLSEPVELIWDKVSQNSGDLTIPWGNQHEYIQFAVCLKGPIERQEGGGRLAARLRRGSILRYQRPNGDAVTRHPTEKPVGLLRELIESSSCIGETVLDPFVGCGSTLVAARLESRRAIGIEIEERYCEIAAKRLEQGVLDFGGAA